MILFIHKIATKWYLILFSVVTALLGASFMIALSAAAENTDYIVQVSGAKNTAVCISQVDFGDSSHIIDVLDVQIETAGKVLYAGKFCDIPSPVTPWIPLASNESCLITVTLTMPKSADNLFQGAEFCCIWTFGVQGDSGVTAVSTQRNNSIYYNPNMDPGDVSVFKILLKNGPGEIEKPPNTGINPTRIVNVNTGTGYSEKALILFFATLLAAAVTGLMLLRSSPREKNDKPRRTP